MNKALKVAMVVAGGVVALFTCFIGFCMYLDYTCGDDFLE